MPERGGLGQDVCGDIEQLVTQCVHCKAHATARARAFACALNVPSTTRTAPKGVSGARAMKELYRNRAVQRHTERRPNIARAITSAHDERALLQLEVLAVGKEY